MQEINSGGRYSAKGSK